MTTIATSAGRVGLLMALIVAYSIISGSAARAELLLTFDDQSGQTVLSASISESGFTFTQSLLGTKPHFGDGASPRVGTLNWHDGGANAVDMLVILTQDSGANFDLLDFDIAGLGTPLVVDASGYATRTFSTVGTKSVDFLNVSSVSFDVGNSVAIDNVRLRATATAPVPEPTSLLILGVLVGALPIVRRAGRTAHR